MISLDQIGLIGVGLLGSAMLRRLVGAGFPTLAFDVNPERQAAIASLGGQPAASASEVAKSCQRILLSLPDSSAVESVATAILPDLSPGTILLDTTTGEPERSAQLARALAARGISFVETTVIGSSRQMLDGEAVLLVGGIPKDVEACADLLACLGKRHFSLGPVGSASRMKLVVNLVLGLNRAALAEGLALARACGLDWETTLAALKSGAAYSAVMDTKGAKMIHGDFEPQARLTQHRKDVGLMLAEARRHSIQLPLSELHDRLLEMVEAAGHGDEDNAAILRAYIPGQ